MTALYQLDYLTSAQRAYWGNFSRRTALFKGVLWKCIRSNAARALQNDEIRRVNWWLWIACLGWAFLSKECSANTLQGDCYRKHYEMTCKTFGQNSLSINSVKVFDYRTSITFLTFKWASFSSDWSSKLANAFPLEKRQFKIFLKSFPVETISSNFAASKLLDSGCANISQYGQ